MDTFGEITFNKKSHATVPLKIVAFAHPIFSKKNDETRLVVNRTITTFDAQDLFHCRRFSITMIHLSNFVLHYRCQRIGLNDVVSYFTVRIQTLLLINHLSITYSVGVILP